MLCVYFSACLKSCDVSLQYCSILGLHLSFCSLYSDLNVSELDFGNRSLNLTVAFTSLSSSNVYNFDCPSSSTLKRTIFADNATSFHSSTIQPLLIMIKVDMVKLSARVSHVLPQYIQEIQPYIQST